MSDYADRLDRARRIMAADPDRLRGKVPPGMLDQFAAAARDTHGTFLDVSGVLTAAIPGMTLAASGDRDRAARLLAAVLGCKPCPHLRRTPAQPSHADLNLRLLLCRRCVRTLCEWSRCRHLPARRGSPIRRTSQLLIGPQQHHHRVRRHPLRRHHDDDRCELCDSRGHTVFRESLFVLGQILVHGNVAGCCEDVVLTEQVIR